MEVKTEYRVAVGLSPSNQHTMTELDKLNQAKRRYRDATTCLLEGWRRRDDAIEAEDWNLVNEWDLTMDGFITRRDRAYAKLQVAFLHYDAAGDCICPPLSSLGAACKSCNAAIQLGLMDDIPC